MYKSVLHYKHSMHPTCFGYNVANLREVPYKGWIYGEITEVCEPMHRGKILF